MPIIPVKLVRGSTSVGVWALVDSGANRCIFDAQYADSLGIEDVDQGREMTFSRFAPCEMLAQDERQP